MGKTAIKKAPAKPKTTNKGTENTPPRTESRITQKRDRLLRFASHVTRNFDPEVYAKHCEDPKQSELLSMAADPSFDPTDLSDSQANELEAIVVRQGRPVLLVENSEVEQSDDRLWSNRINSAASQIRKNISAVCRIEVKGHALNDYAVPGEEVYLGTGFLVGPNVILTNRHVAVEFCNRDGSIKGGMSANIDFVEELERDTDKHFAVTRALEIGQDYDYALLEVSKNVPTPEPVSIAASIADVEQDPLVYLVGYPAFDTRNPTDIQNQIFGGIYDVKRFAPGRIRDFASRTPTHPSNASTPVIWSDYTSLGGNSGSPVFCFSTGDCVALHFAGRYGEANYSVPIWAIADRIRAAVKRASSPSHDPLYVSTHFNGGNKMNNDVIGMIMNDRANYMPLGAAKRIAASKVNTRSLSQVLDAAAASVVLGHFGHENEKLRLCGILSAVTPALASACATPTAQEAIAVDWLGMVGGSGPYNPTPQNPTPFNPDPYYAAMECISYPGGGGNPYEPQPRPANPWQGPSYRMQPWAINGQEGIDAKCIAGVAGGAISGGVSGGIGGAIGGAISGAVAGGCFD